MVSQKAHQTLVGRGKRYDRRNEIEAINFRGEVVREADMIEQAFYENYREFLGQARGTEGGFATAFLPLMSKLDEEIKAGLEAPISLSQIEIDIDHLTPGKSPGPDGLAACFYRALRRELSVALYSVFRKAYEVKQLPTSFKKYHAFIPKSEEATVLLSVSAYRPISLTNVDYKILMKVLGNRLQGVIK